MTVTAVQNSELEAAFKNALFREMHAADVDSDELSGRKVGHNHQPEHRTTTSSLRETPAIWFSASAERRGAGFIFRQFGVW